MYGPNTDEDWPVWRLVIEQIATLHEIETHWSIADVLDANEALDVQADVTMWRQRQRQAQGEAERGQAKAIREAMGRGR